VWFDCLPWMNSVAGRQGGFVNIVVDVALALSSLFQLVCQAVTDAERVC
jgi:hypothetical protein